MAASALGTAPVLSTPDTHVFEDPTPTIDPSSQPRLSDEQVVLTYEIERTVQEIKQGRWKRIALQFPDHMLGDSPRVYEYLTRGLQKERKFGNGTQKEESLETEVTVDGVTKTLADTTIEDTKEVKESLFILGDTSYGACCVDEVAAEHVDADVVVHYGRSCLSPPSRLPVIYVFTERPLELEPMVSTFRETYTDKQAKVILMADIPYSHHIPLLHTRLQEQGYTNVYATTIVHNPSSPLPNRTIPTSVSDGQDALNDYALFHISNPPTSLLLTLSSRVSSIHIYPTDTTSSATQTASLASTSMALRRRYALLTKLSTNPVYGILINTLSVKNYMHILSHVQEAITAAGKKYYTFVVGKVNAAKVANFSEVGGWVVIGCWESSLIESSEFWRPMITPWELRIALKSDEERVWTGEWDADFQTVLDEGVEKKKEDGDAVTEGAEAEGEAAAADDQDEFDSEEESAPPEFDLRTGRYVSHSRPMRAAAASKAPLQNQSEGDGNAVPSTSTAVTKRATGEIASVGGIASPGAEYLRSNRTWQGLGSDFYAIDEETGERQHAAKMEEGRSGIARGYVVGDDDRRH